ncbi:MAG: tRNA glutamyl-Q(34) synthetase GluQRS [Tepidimonas taiwanensis]|nr:tRNA glutamyl-Q(34) synthetase GluQRS [Tepidimonas taiwanensis]
MPAARYRGRFAPTPSGALHLGSLVAALGSCLEARVQDGEWLLRIEDVDAPRVVAGAAEDILRTLEAFGFEWDGPVWYQSRRSEAYAEALARLARDGLVYACSCSRSQIRAVARRGVDGPVYPGSCRARADRPSRAAWRLRLPDERVVFTDALFGRVSCELARECGDFVLRRADGVYSYQLAVVVDDAAQGVTHVVRGADLLASTPRQIVLQRLLALPTPQYLHLPVVLDARGDKLSKQTLAAPVDAHAPLPALLAAWRFLGQSEPGRIDTVAEFWAMARALWDRRRIPPLRGRRMPAAGLSAGSLRAPA